ncbi:hypothetical protein BDK51DRAFT_28876 [Blyttiomyces helicus]|uniref:Uncharacterized protein n=1 Tax=Blyttiomyces helicus TaxID=388810 RepID=A0A4P9WPN5_9FUNG|nr:hypothetical protein BDK51DRAFT_28876 [Blyttiomyces helicus]|eukprot:RKO93220.1 hypothetical protein BDK51DRAFT_28876 [Blyttiomyces helicus]
MCEAEVTECQSLLGRKQKALDKFPKEDRASSGTMLQATTASNFGRAREGCCDYPVWVSVGARKQRRRLSPLWVQERTKGNGINGVKPFSVFASGTGGRSPTTSSDIGSKDDTSNEQMWVCGIIDVAVRWSVSKGCGAHLPLQFFVTVEEETVSCFLQQAAMRYHTVTRWGQELVLTPVRLASNPICESRQSAGATDKHLSVKQKFQTMFGRTQKKQLRKAKPFLRGDRGLQHRAFYSRNGEIVNGGEQQGPRLGVSNVHPCTNAVCSAMEVTVLSPQSPGRCLDCGGGARIRLLASWMSNNAVTARLPETGLKHDALQKAVAPSVEQQICRDY